MMQFHVRTWVPCVIQWNVWVGAAGVTLFKVIGDRAEEGRETYLLTVEIIPGQLLGLREENGQEVNASWGGCSEVPHTMKMWPPVSNSHDEPSDLSLLRGCSCRSLCAAASILLSQWKPLSSIWGFHTDHHWNPSVPLSSRVKGCTALTAPRRLRTHPAKAKCRKPGLLLAPGPTHGSRKFHLSTTRFHFLCQAHDRCHVKPPNSPLGAFL